MRTHMDKQTFLDGEQVGWLEFPPSSLDRPGDDEAAAAAADDDNAAGCRRTDGGGAN